MPDFANRLKQLRTTHKLTQAALAKELNVTQNAIFNWENGKREPNLEMIEQIANFFNISISELLGMANYFGIEKSDLVEEKGKRAKKGITINVVGRVAAGIPIEAIEEIIDTEEITEEMARTGSFFGLKIKGDSMEPQICEGDIVIVRQQEDADSDEIVIALVNGNDGVCKRLKKYENSIALVSINTNYEPMYFTNKEIVDKPVRIIGKVVELRRKL